MGKKFFLLEPKENSLAIKIFQIVLGVLCIIIAIYWLIFNIKAVKTDGTLWITVFFLAGFGIFQVYSGLGYALKFIELNTNKIRLKKNSLFPPVEIPSDQIEKIELYPLKFILFIKPAKRMLVRLGTSNPEKTELIKDEIISFTTSTGISLEIKNEEI